MDMNFKFEVGQVVYQKSEVVNYEKSKNSYRNAPQGMTVVERHYQECGSASQLLYFFRGFKVDPNSVAIGTHLFNLTEIELVDSYMERGKE